MERVKAWFGFNILVLCWGVSRPELAFMYYFYVGGQSRGQRGLLASCGVILFPVL